MKVIWVAKTAEESEEAEKAALAGAVKEVEPLLADAGPFFGGSDKLTLAEVSHFAVSDIVAFFRETFVNTNAQSQVLTGSFVQRLLVSIEAGGIFTESFVSSLQEQTPNFWKWAKAVAAHPSVTGVLDEKWFAEWVKDRIATARA
jgi:glutathione S-transferase